MDLLHAESESSHLVEDLVGGSYPPKGDAAFIVCLDVSEDRVPELGDARVGIGLSAFSVSNPKKRSTRFSHDA